jgi:hypothetical protein
MNFETDSLFPNFVSAMAPKQARESRAFPNPIVYISSRAVMENIVVACALGCVFGCGAKNRAADDTTSADAVKTPATVEQAARVLDLTTFPLIDGAKSAESRHVANLSTSHPAMRTRLWNSTGGRSPRKAGKNCLTALSRTNRPAQCSRVTGLSFRFRSFHLKRTSCRSGCKISET